MIHPKYLLQENLEVAQSFFPSQKKEDLDMGKFHSERRLQAHTAY